MTLRENKGVNWTYPDLLKALDAAFAEVTIENVLGWFSHCCYCTSED